MGIKDRGELLETLKTGGGFSRVAGMFLMALVICLVLIGGAASDSGDNDRTGEGRFCSATADAVFRACGFEARNDYFVATAVCTNISGDAERTRCFADAIASLREHEQLCRRQLKARRDVCAALGEGRYDPDFGSVSFEDDYKNLRNPNRYFPLRIGNRWEYRGGTESVTVEVLDETKLIEGVRCVVVRDLVKDEGRVIEDTDDWFAQAKDGAVWYCGEEVKDFQTFQGDRPRQPELVSIDGSFKVGRNGDKPGIIFLASPRKGSVYREEFSLGNAEDVSEVLSTTYAFGSDRELDRFVPRRLANLLCSRDCVVTKNYAPIEPGIIARKYYARGIGFFLEVNPDTGDIVQLVDCNFDPRCADLPPP